MNDDMNLFDPDLPILPYNGTSGYAGSDASEERAKRDDRTGRTAERQRMVLKALDKNHVYGATWKDLEAWFHWHHGQASGVLSVLHKANVIVRLDERRDRCHIYVLPKWVDGRKQSNYRRRMTQADMQSALLTVKAMLRDGETFYAHDYVVRLLEENFPN